MNEGNLKQQLKQDTLTFFGALGFIGFFIGLYYVRAETAYLNFLPESPLALLIGLIIGLEVVAFTALVYDQL